jgi:hypothetical protein
MHRVKDGGSAAANAVPAAQSTVPDSAAIQPAVPDHAADHESAAGDPVPEGAHNTHHPAQASRYYRYETKFINAFCWWYTGMNTEQRFGSITDQCAFAMWIWNTATIKTRFQNLPLVWVPVPVRWYRYMVQLFIQIGWQLPVYENLKRTKK